MSSKKKWFALLTRSRFENVVYDHITKKAVEAFLPKIKVKSRRRDRHLMIDVPLFPGYLFVNISPDPESQLTVLKTLGAVRLLGYQSGPVAIPSNQVESLKIVTSSGRDVISGEGALHKTGDRVMVIKGVLSGVTGEFVRYKGKNRVIINIDTLGQFAGVEIDEDDLERLPDILS